MNFYTLLVSCCLNLIMSIVCKKFRICVFMHVSNKLSVAIRGT